MESNLHRRGGSLCPPVFDVQETWRGTETSPYMLFMRYVLRIASFCNWVLRNICYKGGKFRANAETVKQLGFLLVIEDSTVQIITVVA